MGLFGRPPANGAIRRNATRIAKARAARLAIPKPPAAAGPMRPPGFFHQHPIEETS